MTGMLDVAPNSRIIIHPSFKSLTKSNSFLTCDFTERDFLTEKIAITVITKVRISMISINTILETTRIKPPIIGEIKTWKRMQSTPFHSLLHIHPFPNFDISDSLTINVISSVFIRPRSEAIHGPETEKSFLLSH